MAQILYIYKLKHSFYLGVHRHRMVVGFTTICAISAYHHLRCEFEPHSLQGVFDTTLYRKVCQ